jgi:hypothetical protein
MRRRFAIIPIISVSKNGPGCGEFPREKESGIAIRPPTVAAKPADYHTFVAHRWQK